MGEVKRYAGYTCGVFEAADGEYVEHSDYARLERERDELSEELQATEDELEGCMEELTRLRAVEAAANAVVSDALADVRVHPCDYMNNEARAQQLYGTLRALAEACGRKG